jgi:hypothetical protein
MSHPTPSLLFFDPTTLEPLRPSLADLPPSSRLSIPTFALSGRLLAYTTSDPPRHTGKDGLGTLITSSSTVSRLPQTRRQTPPKNVINSAVGIGGGVARGVWAGIKMGAQAASRATNGRMATSAPTHSTLPHEEGEVESRSLDDSSVLDESISVDPPSPSPSPLRVSGSDSSLKQGGEWIKIIDLTHSRTIAHFRLPPSRNTVSTVTTGTRRFSETGHSAVSHLAFSPDGTTLFAAPADGRSFHLFEIHPHTTPPGDQPEVQGEVWHLYELRRGNTVSEVVEVNWSSDGRWMGVATGRGTVRKLSFLHPEEPADIQMYSPSIPQEVLRMRLPILPFDLLTLIYSSPFQLRSHPPPDSVCVSKNSTTRSLRLQEQHFRSAPSSLIPFDPVLPSSILRSIGQAYNSSTSLGFLSPPPKPVLLNRRVWEGEEVD